MNSVIRGIYYKDKEPKLEFKKISALTTRQNTGKNIYIDTIWGRQVFGIEIKENGILFCPDLHGGLPIYTYTYNNSLFFANTFEDLLEIIPTNQLPNIDKNNVLKFLMMENDSSGETILENVHICNGFNQIFWNGNKWEPRRYNYSDKIIDSEQNFHTIMGESLAWTNHFKDGEIGVTLSGGIDSAVVWTGLIYAGIKPVALTVLFPGRMGDRQKTKIEEIIQRSNSQWLTITGENFNFDNKNVNPYRNIYANLNLELGIKAKNIGVRVILGGAGGDELARNAGFHNDSTSIGDEKRIPGYITALAVDTWESLSDQTFSRPGLVASSALNVNGITGEVNEGANLWRENILCYPDFWKWSASQPAAWGEHKQGFRDYLIQLGVKAIPYSGFNEDYRDIYLCGIRHLLTSEYFNELMSHSVLGEWGWIEPEKILELKHIPNQYFSISLKHAGSVYLLEKFLQWYILRKEV